MPSDFWGGWITVVTVVTLIALGWLVLSVYFSPESIDVAEETWDETLREGATPAPLWWFWLILALMAVSVVYLILYPGLGTFRGALGWTQAGRVEQGLVRYDETFGADRQRLAEASLSELQTDPLAMRSAQSLFAVHCAACHGPEGLGQANLFPSLRDDVWQWGGSESEIQQSIAAGRVATMPPWEAVLGQQGVTDVASYVLWLAAGSAEADKPEAGEEPFRAYCSACHGLDGSGVAILGGPTLNDDEWVYGGTLADVRESIAVGRSGQMPAFGDRLDSTQLRLLVAWLMRE